jgi:hypothetical protein
MWHSSFRRLLIGTAFAALAMAAGASASPGFAIDGLRIRPPNGAFGATAVGTCDLRTYTGCKVKTFTVENVGSQTILIGGYGIFDLDPSIAALVPSAGECSSLPLVGGYWALQPGGSCVIGVAFAATEKGRMQNELHIWHTDQFSPIAVVPLSGVGT